jgi:NAD(P)-dependent dehydrogenase (short-subunit alcohol dehydrogenase family)
MKTSIRTFDLADKVILITGGYGYLGKPITKALIYHGAKVFVLGREEKKFSEAFSDVEFDKDYLGFEVCDIADSKSIKNAYQKISLTTGKIDALINNAFYSRGNSPENLSDDDWNFGIDGTLNSVFRCIREIIPYFKNAGSGKIVNVASMYGIVAPDFSIYDSAPQFLNPPHYGAAKAGIIQLTRYYASYLGNYGITVNAVTPGPFPSDGVQTNSEFINQLRNKTVLNRIGRPEDVAGAFVYLISNAADFVTGQNIIVDGGWTIK